MTKTHQKGFAVIEALLIVLVIVLLAGTGWYVYRHRDRSIAASRSSSKQASKTSTVPTTTQPDPYAGWRSYTSSTEKLTFKYPAEWTAIPSSDSTQVTGADSLKLTSKSGKISVRWYSSVEGIGGACSVYTMPGTAVKSGDLGPCPYFTVLDKQKLAGANLYYVDGVVEQSDGKAYSAWCGLQDNRGIIHSKSNIGYMLFKAKNTFAGTNNANSSGLYQAELACGSGLGGIVGQPGTKEQAAAFLSTTEMQQAKLILLSATY